MTTNITSGDGKPLAVNGGLMRTGYSFNTIVIKDLDPEHLEQLLNVKITPNRDFYAYSPLVLEASEIKSFEDLDYPKLVEICSKFDTYLLGISGITSEENVKCLKKSLLSIPIALSESERKACNRVSSLRPLLLKFQLKSMCPMRSKLQSL